MGREVGEGREIGGREREKGRRGRKKGRRGGWEEKMEKGGGIEGKFYHRILRLPDLPSVDLLPPKVITDLRDVAAYYHDSPGENHSGKQLLLVLVPL